jgi:GT2 family glycosyltransferase
MPALREPITISPALSSDRPSAAGKFLSAGDEKLWIRGVTYGTFRPDPDGNDYALEAVDRDFAAMAEAGINTVRTYTAPPRWLLDRAAEHGLRVMVGLPWEQHIAFLDRARAKAILDRLRESVRLCAGHPAVLCFAVGNEIPSSIVRWYGAKRIEAWIERLCHAVKAVDPDALVTYVNYPSTEYLELPFLDIVCFNVYLEQRERLEAYLARLQNLAGDRPLMLAELGLDSLRNGLERQADTLDWQIRSTFASGCSGLFVFSWTDEWHRGGFDIEDWDFGLITRKRQPKPALAAVSRAFAETPFSSDTAWPRVSVVVCTRNGARTLHDCLTGLDRLDYPDYEVIIVDDGSTDASAAIASEYDVRLISTENRGLSVARNTGMEAATGEIVVYTDDDARPDPDWLRYLAWSFLTTDHASIGGPNIAPGGDGPIATCVANAPGGPVHVLLTDEIAEHIPGCNMAFRRDRLIEIGGFDPRFRTAGDDVDLCWRMQYRGWTIGFNPAAMVWHHRRNSVRTYWKQQTGYGKAEALLEAKWPNRYNRAGHVAWAGRLYGNGWTKALGSRMGRIYQGTWGQAPFQALYHRQTSSIAALPLMPEWWLVVCGLALLLVLGLAWSPLLYVLPLLVLAVAAPVIQAWLSAGEARFPAAMSGPERFRLRLLTAGLHLAQPVARLKGRLLHGLTPWRRRGVRGFALPLPRTVNIWSETWQAPEEWLGEIEQRLIDSGVVVRRGGNFDGWDIEVRAGLFGSARLLHAIEEHGGGKQLARFRVWPRWSWLADCTIAIVAMGGVLALQDSAEIAGMLLLLIAGVVAVLSLLRIGAAVALLAGCANSDSMWRTQT